MVYRLWGLKAGAKRSGVVESYAMFDSPVALRAPYLEAVCGLT